MLHLRRTRTVSPGIRCDITFRKFHPSSGIRGYDQPNVILVYTSDWRDKYSFDTAAIRDCSTPPVINPKLQTRPFANHWDELSIIITFDAPLSLSFVRAYGSCIEFLFTRASVHACLLSKLLNTIKITNVKIFKRRILKWTGVIYATYELRPLYDRRLP